MPKIFKTTVIGILLHLILGIIITANGQTLIGGNCIGPHGNNGQLVYVTDNGTCNPYTNLVLVFHDEFEGNSLDKSKWMTAPHDSRIGAKDYYTDGANYIFNHPGLSLIEKNDGIYARGIPWQPDDYTLNDGGPNLRTWSYTSGMLYSKYKFSYGAYKITCQVPSGRPFHPNFWQYGKPDGLDNEIDACEMFCNDNSSTDDNPYHVSFNNHHDIYDCPFDFTDNTYYPAAFHTFEYYWDNYTITWLIDGSEKAWTAKFFDVLGRGLECNDIIVGGNPYILNKAFPFPPMNIYVTCNVGRAKVGCDPDDASVFPAEMNIQSVQYYELLPCTQGPITIHEADLNSIPDFFNVFTASTVNVGGDVSIPSVGALEILATNAIYFSAGFTSHGYLVAKTQHNPCDGARKMSGSSSDSSSNKNHYPNNISSKGLNYSKDEFTIKPIPASTKITIEYALERSENVMIELCDVVGNRLYTIINSYQSAGKYSIPFSVTNLSNGVYICNIKKGVSFSEKKIIIAH